MEIFFFYTYFLYKIVKSYQIEICAPVILLINTAQQVLWSKLKSSDHLS